MTLILFPTGKRKHTKYQLENQDSFGLARLVFSRFSAYEHDYVDDIHYVNSPKTDFRWMLAPLPIDCVRFTASLHCPIRWIEEFSLTSCAAFAKLQKASPPSKVNIFGRFSASKKAHGVQNRAEVGILEFRPGIDFMVD